MSACTTPFPHSTLLGVRLVIGTKVLFMDSFISGERHMLALVQPMLSYRRRGHHKHPRSAPRYTAPAVFDALPGHTGNLKDVFRSFAAGAAAV